MRPAHLAGLSLLAGALFLAGCASSKSEWSPKVDTANSPRAQNLSTDMDECRAVARDASGSTAGKTAKGSAVGGGIGAAGGVAVGAAVGKPMTGAALGAAGGAAGGGIAGNRRSDKRFKEAFRNCLTERGHKVVN